MSTESRQSDLTMGDLVLVGLLASPGFVLPPLVGPTFETVGLTVLTTAAAVCWVVRRARISTRSPVRRDPAPR